MLSLIVGFCEVLQETPRAVTESFPSEVTIPPQTADEGVMSETDFVKIVGKEKGIYTVMVCEEFCTCVIGVDSVSVLLIQPKPRYCIISPKEKGLLLSPLTKWDLFFTPK